MLSGTIHEGDSAGMGHPSNLDGPFSPSPNPSENVLVNDQAHRCSIQPRKEMKHPQTTSFDSETLQRQQGQLALPTNTDGRRRPRGTTGALAPRPPQPRCLTPHSRNSLTILPLRLHPHRTLRLSAAVTHRFPISPCTPQVHGDPHSARLPY